MAKTRCSNSFVQRNKQPINIQVNFRLYSESLVTFRRINGSDVTSTIESRAEREIEESRQQKQKMVICAVVSCKNNPENTVGVSFHRFPNAEKRKELYSKWIHAVNRVNLFQLLSQSTNYGHQIIILWFVQCILLRTLSQRTLVQWIL